ncbi:hypothetical protein CDD83_3164 [Cordyceps sp. RAO-2017]|nr:hypothetical protein CDD83_3164 [Cordyceps sp. RAO-2017]
MSLSKLLNNLRHMGAEKSPCIPQNLMELAAFKAEVAEANRSELTRRVGRRLAELEMKKALMQDNPPPRTLTNVIGRLLGGRRFADGKSPVFASDNYFNEHAPGRQETRRHWPSLAALKGEGDRRGAGHNRCLPPPHRPAADPTCPPAAAREKEMVLSGGTSRRTKAPFCDRAFITPVTPPETRDTGEGDEGVEDDEAELRFGELPEHLQATIRYILRELGRASDA